MLNVMSENSGSVVVLRFSGRIVAGEDISTLLNVVISQKNTRAVVLDLTRVNRIDACGLGILMFMKQWATGASVGLELIPSKPVQELLDLTGLHSLFKIRSTEDDHQSVSDFLVDSREDSAIGIAADD